MEYSIMFRAFEERDADFIYACKNDENLNSMIVGQYRPITHKEAEQWVEGVIRADRKDMRFWAICTNDEERRIVGWISLSEIDLGNKSACFHGLVIGDPKYRDGTAWVESYILILEYAFEKYNLNRLYGTYLPNHIMTKSMANSVFFVTEGVYRQSFLRDGKYHDEVFASLLASEYYEHKNNGDYTFNSIYKRLIKELRKQKNNDE